MTAPDLHFDGPDTAALTVALAHGAGLHMHVPFMTRFAEGLAGHGLRVARFDFPYMAAARRTGTRRPPDPAPVLLDTWRSVIAALTPAERLVIGGKSMGGRMASMLADEAGVAACVCLGYPFHPPGKPEQRRVDHLEHIKTPTLILQGGRDPFGTRDEVPDYPLSSAVRVHWLADGDHHFNPHAASSRTVDENWDEGVETVAAFVAEL